MNNTFATQLRRLRHSVLPLVLACSAAALLVACGPYKTDAADPDSPYYTGKMITLDHTLNPYILADRIQILGHRAVKNADGFWTLQVDIRNNRNSDTFLDSRAVFKGPDGLTVYTSAWTQTVITANSTTAFKSACPVETEVADFQVQFRALND